MDRYALSVALPAKGVQFHCELSAEEACDFAMELPMPWPAASSSATVGQLEVQLEHMYLPHVGSVPPGKAPNCSECRRTMKPRGDGYFCPNCGCTEPIR